MFNNESFVVEVNCRGRAVLGIFVFIYIMVNSALGGEASFNDFSVMARAYSNFVST